MFYADLHLHSKYSRATSRNLDLERLFLWARKKGIQVLGTGDFTHPAWRAELKEKLIPAEPGLFQLREGRLLERQYPMPSGKPMRFLLEVEVSTIYKKGGKTRKVHHLLYAPDWEKADRLVARLAKIGNLQADGRPILGLDSRDLLEITLQSGDGCHLIPAHVWTPWFSALGSKSGFDAVEECYGDMAPHIFAIETGLSSDPWMNRKVSSLDRFALVSNSDAHSPGKVGREATVFHTEMSYPAMMKALQTKEGLGGTAEFFPEEGKYHLDGCRRSASPRRDQILRRPLYGLRQADHRRRYEPRGRVGGSQSVGAFAEGNRFFQFSSPCGNSFRNRGRGREQQKGSTHL